MTSNLVQEHEDRAPSIAFNPHDNAALTETHLLAKLPPKKKLPPRDEHGRFKKRKRVEPELTDSTLPSSDSSPLDTPEINQRALEIEQDESEQEVIQQLADDEQSLADDEESLSGAPDPSSITLPLFDGSQTEEEEDERRKPLQFPTVEPPSPPRDPPQTPVPTPIKLRATQATVPSHKLTSQIPTLVTTTSATPHMSNATGPPALFHGRSDENAQNFLRGTEMYILINGVKDEAVKVAIFSTLISAGSQADLWWTNLDTAHKASWSAVRTAFIAKWPAIVAADKTKLEYQKELLALRLKEEEVGERITVAGIETWSHVHFHGTLRKLVQDAGVETAPILIQPVRDALPRTLRDLTSPAPPDWDTFLNEIKNANIDTLLEKVKRAKERKEVEKAQNARIARLETRQHDPVENLRLQMQRTSIGTPVNQTAPYMSQPQNAHNAAAYNSQARRQVRYVTGNQPGTVPRPRGQPPTQEERDLMRTRVNELTHHPDTAAGQAAYEEQLRQWRSKWGSGARCSEHTPVPLTPGTAQICSGECFRCGAHGHISPDCQVPQDAQLTKNETIWRGICTRTLGTFNRATAPQVNVVFEGAYIHEVEDQGKGEGSSV
jgi:hypothetical protein